ncbi:MAG: WYL domain-containing protein, partial [Tannerella sp.]|nr:WYL domain-containing protein [Tannerella sp.]
MPVNRNALIRYKTIDTCLRNKYRRWTLEDLIDACSDALYEFEGIYKGISKRTVQMDIQMMRSEKLGYNAPIVVYDNKYYKYEDEDYSITNTPLSEQDLKIMSEAVEVLRQFKGFSYFLEMRDIVNRLEDHVSSVRQKSVPVIDFEKNESLKGLYYLDIIYRAIVNKQVLNIQYRPFKALSANTFIFYPYLLKEYRNRWFVFGRRKNALTNL